MDALYVEWSDVPSSQRINTIKLNSVDVFSGIANNSPTDWPADHNWDGNASDREIASGATVELLLQFDAAFAAPPPVYLLKPTFNIGCYVQGSY